MSEAAAYFKDWVARDGITVTRKAKVSGTTDGYGNPAITYGVDESVYAFVIDGPTDTVDTDTGIVYEQTKYVDIATDQTMSEGDHVIINGETFNVEAIFNGRTHKRCTVRRTRE